MEQSEEDCLFPYVKLSCNTFFKIGTEICGHPVE